jgi:hypothetical protein
MNTLMIGIGGFILILVMLVFLRAKTGNKFEIKNSDIVLALVPIALWLFLTGQIQEFAFGDIKIVSAIKEASKSPVAPQVTALPVENVQMDPKRGVGEIPSLIKKKNQALSFRMGHGGYWGPAISQYLKALTQYPYLRHLVIQNSDGSFFGMADARQVAEIIRAPGGDSYAKDLANWLNSSTAERLKTLPGFISSEQALKKIADKFRALQLMDSLDVQMLPVVDDSRRFAGIVDRSKLTASMLIDIAKRIETGK